MPRRERYGGGDWMTNGDQLAMRVGIGYDVHRFAAGRRLVLGGIEIPAEHGLEGYSDADVALHAISDALLGALALGDIGQHFPPGDPRWRDADSLDLLQRVVALVDDAGYRVGNIDLTIIAEAPRIAPHVPRMREVICAALQTTIDRVSIKATTNERMGFIGRHEGIAAIAVATVTANASA